MIIILQASLEWNGKVYQPGEEVDVPEEIYDYLVDSYLKNRTLIESSDEDQVELIKKSYFEELQ
jgi:hypothetical protein